MIVITVAFHTDRKPYTDRLLGLETIVCANNFKEPVNTCFGICFRVCEIVVRFASIKA